MKKKVRNLSKAVFAVMFLLVVFVGGVNASLIQVGVIESQMIGDMDNLNGHADYTTGFTPGLPGFSGIDWSFTGDFTDMALNTLANPINTLNFKFNGITSGDEAYAATLRIAAATKTSNDPGFSDPMVTINDGPPGGPVVIGTRIGNIERDGYNRFDVYTFDLMPWLDRLTKEEIYFSLGFNSPNDSFLPEGQIAIDWMEFGYEAMRWVDDGTGGGGDPTAPVPEPATMLLFGTGLIGLLGSRIYKNRKTQK